MPKKLSDKDRILAFAFRATSEDLVDAIAVLKAAHAAKAGGKGMPRLVKPAGTRRPAPAPKAADSPNE